MVVERCICGHDKHDHQTGIGCLALNSEDIHKNIDIIKKRVCECVAEYSKKRKKRPKYVTGPKISLAQLLGQGEMRVDDY